MGGGTGQVENHGLGLDIDEWRTDAVIIRKNFNLGMIEKG